MRQHYNGTPLPSAQKNIPAPLTIRPPEHHHAFKVPPDAGP